jgi:hypothetical protein
LATGQPSILFPSRTGLAPEYLLTAQPSGQEVFPLADKKCEVKPEIFGHRPYSLSESVPMGESPFTRASLPVRIRDGRDVDAWSRFVEVDGAMIYDYRRRHGLKNADPADLTPGLS